MHFKSVKFAVIAENAGADSLKDIDRESGGVATQNESKLSAGSVKLFAVFEEFGQIGFNFPDFAFCAASEGVDFCYCCRCEREHY